MAVRIHNKYFRGELHDFESLTLGRFRNNSEKFALKSTLPNDG